ncbi:MAG: sugar ABC transporter permease [Microlunatus sp.]|nr:sugar ABC transporter permease [Microlunatus sp.]
MPARSSSRALRTVAPYLYLIPMVGFVGVFLLYPAVATIRLSFTDWDGIHPARWVGVQNYLQLAADPAFLTACLNTLYWVVGIMILQVGLGLLIAVLINASALAELFKRIIYLPATVSGAAIGVLWFVIYNPQLGILNTTLRFLHLDFLTRQWLTDPPWNTFAMIISGIWQGLGPTMILFLVGLQNIPREPLEAGRIDGAGPVRLFRYVTLPLLRPMTVVVVAISLINSFKVFDIIWVMTQGGPYRSSETLAVTMYRDSFVEFNFGYGASVAVVLTAIVFAVSVPYMRAMFRRVEVN